MTFPTRGQFANRRPPVAVKTPTPKPESEPDDATPAEDPATDPADPADGFEEEGTLTDAEPEPNTTDDDPVATPGAPAAEPAPAAPAETSGKDPKPAPKSRSRKTAKNAGAPVLIVVKDGTVTASTDAVVIDLDTAAADGVDAHQVVDMMTELARTGDTPIRATTLAALTELVTSKAMSA
ncbi:hypothetical protein [Gordonia sihwensis]|uniref:hypothetical protein n=1 Tax=Gordonia sihwensis TaxID=173559 RepID=UPI0005F05D7A|nr:hypothetical protein [Gordonia sihwensis]KJR10495.1 hypothetical protein UG54_00400 [Gordonia sihwensis]